MYRRVRNFRNSVDLTIAEAAEKFGAERSTYGAWEIGKAKKLKPGILERMADFYKTSPETLEEILPDTSGLHEIGPPYRAGGAGQMLEGLSIATIHRNLNEYSASLAGATGDAYDQILLNIKLAVEELQKRSCQSKRASDTATGTDDL